MGTGHTRKDYHVLVDLARLNRLLRSRYRVYPQDVTVAPLLTAAGVANTFGNWVEIVPLNTIPFDFYVVGFCVCTVSAATNYHVQLGYNTVNADPGLNMELGERRFRIATIPIARQSELMDIQGSGIPSYGRVMGRLKTASGNPDTCTLNVVVTRNFSFYFDVPLYPTFPW